MADNGNNGFWQQLFSAAGDFAGWLDQNFEASSAEDVSTEQLLHMQKDQQRALLIVFGLSILAMVFTVYWTGESPHSLT